MKSFFYQHLFSFVFAFSLVYLLLVIGIQKQIFTYKKNSKTITIIGKKESVSGLLPNFKKNSKLELEFLGSLQDKNGITLFGSSELTNESPYIPYHFLPNSLGIRVNAFGHAFQQNFAVFCQLLAFKNDLKNAKICFIISPGWFETKGTNPEAFIEFVPPNFLRKIIHTSSITTEEKLAIGDYLYHNISLIDNPSREMMYFVNTFQYRYFPFLNNFFESSKNQIQKVRYKLYTNSKKVATKNSSIDLEKEIAKKSKDFITSVHSNNLFINDAYFKMEVYKNNTIRKGHFDKLNEEKNTEWKNFQLLIQLLKNTSCKPSFVIQGLNPYHYLELENFNGILKKITNLLKENNFPYLNQFSSDKKKYLPGRLQDIMHTGDVGWLEINKFLYETYEK